MGKLPLRLGLVAVLGLTATYACGATSPTNPGPTGAGSAALQFTHVPIAYSSARGAFGVVQAGYRSVGDNFLRPYLDFNGGGAGATDNRMFAPADGTVTGVGRQQSDGRNRLDVLAAGGYRYYLTGFELSFSVTAGSTISAGQILGQRGGTASEWGYNPVGLGVMHPSRRLGFVSPDRYPDDLVYAVSALDFYAEPERGRILNALQPSQATGELNFDLPGRLQGFWYLPTIPRADSTSVAHSAGWLWFLKTINAQNSGLAGFSVFAPSYEGRATTYFIEPASGPPAADVTPASGVVTYRFPYSSTNAVVLRVQMLSDTSVRAETFDSYSGLPETFTANAKVFVR